MIDARKLAAWIDSAPEASVELLFAQVRDGDDPGLMLLCTWERPFVTATVVEEAIACAQSDCDTQRARCVYQLKLSGKRTTYRRIAVSPRTEERPLDGPTEPATPAGVAALLMRHKEIELRATTGARVDSNEAWKDVLDQQRQFTTTLMDHLGKLQEREIKTVEMYGSLRARDQEYQLKILEMGSNADRMNLLLEKVVAPLVPGLAAQLRGLPPPAAPSPAPAGPRKPPAPSSPAPAPSGDVPPVPDGAPPASGSAPPAQEALAAAPPADAGPMVHFRDLALLLVSHDVDPDQLAESVAASVPEGEQRERAKALVLQTVRGALTHS